MRAVYSPLHLGHEIRLQTVMGVQVPANEVADTSRRSVAAWTGSRTRRAGWSWSRSGSTPTAGTPSATSR